MNLFTPKNTDEFYVPAIKQLLKGSFECTYANFAVKREKKPFSKVVVRKRLNDPMLKAEMCLSMSIHQSGYRYVTYFSSNTYSMHF